MAVGQKPGTPVNTQKAFKKDYSGVAFPTPKRYLFAFDSQPVSLALTHVTSWNAFLRLDVQARSPLGLVAVKCIDLDSPAQEAAEVFFWDVFGMSVNPKGPSTPP